MALTDLARAAGIRALRTFAQTLLTLIPATGVGLGSVDWALSLSSAGIAAGLSILTSIATGLPEVDTEADPPGRHAIDTEVITAIAREANDRAAQAGSHVAQTFYDAEVQRSSATISGLRTALGTHRTPPADQDPPG